MNLDEIYTSSSDTLKAEDLNGKDVTLTIANFTVEEFDEEGKHGPYKARKVVLSFEKTDKRLVVNKINGYAIAGFLSSNEPDKWIGCNITLFPTKTTFGAKLVDCIRIRGGSRPQQQPQQPVESMEAIPSEAPF